MIHEIDAVQLKSKLGQRQDIILIDCREQEEWDGGHIAQAVLAPLSDFENQIKKLGLENMITKDDKEIIIHCRSGKRSMRACEFLEVRGYTHLVNLEGGLLGWQEEGFPVEGREY